jgi:hypothetical protein
MNKYLIPENEMPCDCCGAETNDIVWFGYENQDDIGMFLCPLCIKLTWHEKWTLMMLDAEIEKGR